MKWVFLVAAALALKRLSRPICRCDDRLRPRRPRRQRSDGRAYAGASLRRRMDSRAAGVATASPFGAISAFYVDGDLRARSAAFGYNWR